MFYRQTATESTAAAVLLCVALEYEWVNKNVTAPVCSRGGGGADEASE